MTHQINICCLKPLQARLEGGPHALLIVAAKIGLDLHRRVGQLPRRGPLSSKDNLFAIGPFLHPLADNHFRLSVLIYVCAAIRNENVSKLVPSCPS